MGCASVTRALGAEAAQGVTRIVRASWPLHFAVEEEVAEILRGKVGAQEAEARTEALGPLKVVHERPDEPPAHVDALRPQTLRHAEDR